MDYLLTDEQKMVKELTHKIAEEKIRPVAAKYDESGEFPWDVINAIAEADLFGLFVPEEYGGMGSSSFNLCLATEEFSRACGGIAVCYAASALGTFPIILFGTEEQKKKYLPDLAKGKTIAAFGLTEPEAGSDASIMKTTAQKDGDHYILNGTKHFITNGGEAQINTVIAMTDKSKGPRGASAFIVEKGTKGFSFGKKEEKLGIRASITQELIFSDCRIPKENLISKEGMGFIVTMRTLDISRPGVAAQALGIAQGALEVAAKYSRERHQFEKPISSFQGIQWMLADMATEIEAARALLYSCAREIDAGVKSVAKDSAMAKLFASDVAMKVTTDAVQILGGYGYMKDYPAEKYMRDAKITQIYEGTNRIQRNIIALQLIKEKAKYAQMNIIVCIKQVPEITGVKINPETNTIVREGVKSIINPFDMFAIEEGIRLKEQFGGKSTVITMGPPQAESALREALAMGIEEAVLISDRAFAGSDTWATSYTLSRAIRKISQYDIILCGKQASDGDTAQVGPGISVHLDIPQVTYVKKIADIQDSHARIERMTDDGYEVIEVTLPVLLTVVREINTPRLPSLKGMMRSKKATITHWTALDIEADQNLIGLSGSPTIVTRIFTPAPPAGGQMLEGDTSNVVSQLANALRNEIP